MAEEYNVDLDLALNQFNAINCCKTKLREVLKSKKYIIWEELDDKHVLMPKDSPEYINIV